jgi:Tfp pilus assembly protein PilO
MRQLFFPLFLLILAIGLFAAWTNPTYQATKVLQAQANAYDDALGKSNELRALRDQLLSKRNTFSADDIQKLQEILPDNVDNIRLIIDINNIAARHGLSLKNVALGDVAKGAQTQNNLTVGAATNPVGSVTLGFTVTASYDGFLSFLQDLEHSLRVVDVQKLGFTVNDTKPDETDYNLTIRTYWLH